MATGARTRRARRIAGTALGGIVAELDGVEAARAAFRRSWSGGFRSSPATLYAATPFSTHRDADPLEDSNWNVITRRLQSADSFPAEEHPGVLAEREGSCLSGWVENIYVRRDDAAAIRAAGELLAALADCPVLDEDDYSRREWEADHPDDHTCYAELCSCGQGRHDRMNDSTPAAGCRAWFWSMHPARIEFTTEGGWEWYCAHPGCGDPVPATAREWENLMTVLRD